jgi:hypothetical protein
MNSNITPSRNYIHLPYNEYTYVSFSINEFHSKFHSSTYTGDSSNMFRLFSVAIYRDLLCEDGSLFVIKITFVKLRI